MDENFWLIVFFGTAILLGGLLRLFFGRFRQHRVHSHRAVRLVVGNVLVLAFLLSLAVLAGEIRYRFFYDTTDSFGLTKTTQRWFERHYHVNNWGFRDSVSYQTFLPSGRRRVTFIGDSFTAGHGISNVEERFVNLVRKARGDWDVQMVADCGWDTGRQLEMMALAREGRYELDIVVLAYCLNDIADIVPEWNRIAGRIYEPPNFAYLINHSYVFNTFYYRWKAARDPDVAQYYRFVTTHYDGEVWDRQRARLTTLRDEVHGQGGRLLVVTFPFMHALGEKYPFQHLHERVAEHWDALGVPHLDLLELYGRQAGSELVVNTRDAHPNERAHAMAAEAIVEFIDRQLATPAGPEEPSSTSR